MAGDSQNSEENSSDKRTKISCSSATIQEEVIGM